MGLFFSFWRMSKKIQKIDYHVSLGIMYSHRIKMYQTHEWSLNLINYANSQR